ncbi:UNVERIFIED_CONTAM: hypothetical protein Sradi_7106800 [Sesamum radiatum]|uniref:Uncharacterized protein n=1 Tax=Sesamum radiatum TaxID=300843 RepID=A0AAW2J281_SESRA
MGGGFMFTGNPTSFAAARPPFPATAGTSRSFHTPSSVTAICSSESKPCSQSVGDCAFGSVPSRVEVERAILDLQRFMHGLSASKSGLDGLQGWLHHHDPKMLQSPGFVKFQDAFSMMQEQPALQNMVVSISSDKAVWEAILSNKAVQELQGSISAVKEAKQLSYNEEPDIAMLILRWIMSFTKSKILELVEKFIQLVNEIFQSSPKEKPTSELTDHLEEKVRSSLLLSVVILLIVVVTRSQA